MAHVEDCDECQDRLERLTRCRLTPGVVSTVDATCDGPGAREDVAVLTGVGADAESRCAERVRESFVEQSALFAS